MNAAACSHPCNLLTSGGLSLAIGAALLQVPGGVTPGPKGPQDSLVRGSQRPGFLSGAGPPLWCCSCSKAPQGYTSPKTTLLLNLSPPLSCFLHSFTDFSSKYSLNYLHKIRVSGCISRECNRRSLHWFLSQHSVNTY